MFTNLLIHNITIFNLVSGSTDRYGNETQVFDSGTAAVARVQQLDVGGQARERLGDRDTTSTWFEVFALPSVTVNAYSHIVWGSKRLAVDGQPKLVYDGSGPHHYEIMAKETVGG